MPAASNPLTINDVHCHAVFAAKTKQKDGRSGELVLKSV